MPNYCKYVGEWIPCTLCAHTIDEHTDCQGYPINANTELWQLERAHTDKIMDEYNNNNTIKTKE